MKEWKRSMKRQICDDCNKNYKSMELIIEGTQVFGVSRKGLGEDKFVVITGHVYFS